MASMMAAEQSSATHVNDKALVRLVGPFPECERGVPAKLYAHPKEPRVIYPSGKCVVVRSLEPCGDPLMDGFVYHGHNAPVTVAKWSPSGYWVASADETGRVRVWSWDNPEHLLKVEVVAFSGRIIDLDWDPESKRIVVVGDGKQMSAKCFMWDTGNSVGEMIGHSKRISTVTFKPCRPYRIMTGGEDYRTNWYAGPPFKIAHTNGGGDHSKEVWAAMFAPDGSKLASVGADRKIVFYDPKDGKKVLEVVEGGEGSHSGSILGLCWSPDSARLATCSMDKTVKVWDCSKLEAGGGVTCEATFGPFGNAIADMQCAVTWCGPHLASLNTAGELCLWGPGVFPGAQACEAPARVMVGHTGSVQSLSTLLRGPMDGPARAFVTAGSDGRVLLWEGSPSLGYAATKVVSSDQGTEKRATHGGKAVGAAGCTSQIIASAGFDDKVRFAARVPSVEAAGEPTALALGSLVSCGSVSLQLDAQPSKLCTSDRALGSRLALVATTAGTLVALQANHASQGEPCVAAEGQLPNAGGQASLIEAAALSPDEGECAVGVGNEILVFAVDLASRAITLSRTVSGHRGLVTCLAYSPDGKWLAAGDANREAKVWDRSTWEAKVSGKWVFHTSTVQCLAWDPSSCFVATGSTDQSIMVWSLAKPMKKTAVKFAHKGGVTGLGFLDDQGALASAGHDGAVAIWALELPS